MHTNICTQITQSTFKIYSIEGIDCDIAIAKYHQLYKQGEKKTDIKHQCL